MSDATTKECMWCAEEIKANAKICRFCNREQQATTESSPEEVLYEGLGNPPIKQFLIDLALCLVCVGIFSGLYHLLIFTKHTYRITTKRIEIQRGSLVSKQIDALDLFRVQDLHFASSWGFGTITLITNDRTSPYLNLPIPQAEKVFQQLKVAVEQARREAGVKVRETR